MRLGRIRVDGFRKLVDTECTVVGRVTALIGPNEAGKSSLLDLLVRTGDHDPIEFGARPRGEGLGDEDIAVRLWFRLESDDLAAIQQINSPTQPVWYVLRKTYAGDLTSSLEPRLERDNTGRRRAERAVNTFAATKGAKALERTEDADGLGDRVDRLSHIISGDEEIDPDNRKLVTSVASELVGDDISARGRQAGQALQEWDPAWQGSTQTRRPASSWGVAGPASPYSTTRSAAWPRTTI